MKASPTKRIYLPLALFGVISILLVFFTILPLIKSIKEDSQELLLEKEAQIMFSKEIENIENFEVIHQKIEPDLKRIEDLFVSPKVPIIGSIDFLENTASNSNVLLKISSVSSEKSKDYWPFLNFHVQAFASFSDLSRFIERLENSQYLVEIHSLGMKKMTEGDLRSEELARFSVGDISASLSLKIYIK